MGQANPIQTNKVSGAPLVDSHAHIFTPDMPVSREAWIKPDYEFSADDLLRTLDAHDVHFAVLSGLSIAGLYNDYMLSELRNHKRLRGTVIVSPLIDHYTLSRMRDDGIVGIRLQLTRQDTLADFRSDDWRLLFRRVRDLGWHVHVAIEGEHLHNVLDPLLETGVDIVLDHFGHPNPEDPINCDGFKAMMKAVETGRTWIKMSGGFRLPGTSSWQDPDADIKSLAQMVATELLKRVGTDRLLWGSDVPFVGYENRFTYEDILSTYMEWVPEKSDRDQIDRTALRLYYS